MQPDPTTLTDEQLDAIINGEELELEQEEEEAQKAAPNEEEQEEEQEEVEEEKPSPEDKPEHEEEQHEEEKPRPSRRAEARLRDILQKYPESEQPKQQKQSQESLNYREQLDADEETIKRLEEDRSRSTQDAYQRGAQEAVAEQVKSIQFRTRLEIDAPRVEAKYPILDPTSDEFKQDAAADVNGLYLQMCGFDNKTQKVNNADIRYSTFVEALFNLANDIAVKKVEETTKVVKQQAAKTALRPDGSSATKLNLNKAPSQMSDEELDAVIAQAMGK